MKSTMGAVVMLACLAACITSISACRSGGLATVGAPDACQSCIVGVRVLEDFLCDPAAVDFLVDFEEKRVCPMVGDSPRCHNLAEGLLPVMVQWFRTATTPASLCSAAGVCGSSLQHNAFYNKPSLRVRDTAECSMCKYVVTEVKVTLNNTAMQEQIKQRALEVCSKLPEQLSAACTDFVNTYEPLIVELIEDLDPNDVCTLVGVCGEELAALAAPALPAEVAHALAALRTLAARPAPLMLSPASNEGCDYCKMAVLEAHSLISNVQVQQSLVNYTKAICEQFPTIATECKTYVDQYSLLVFALLEQYLVPDTLCVQIGMCPAPAPPSLMQELRASVEGLLTWPKTTLKKQLMRKQPL